MMVGFQEILLKEKPDYLLVYGDTNSTLAGAIAASKIHVPIIHVEAGLRSFNMRMPEEQNRILTDRISTLLLCPTDVAVENLKRRIDEGVHNVGDVMCDAVLYYSKLLDEKPADYYFSHLEGLFGEISPVKEWYLSTIHRAENTDSIEKIKEILDAFEQLDAPVIFPVHPRTKGLVREVKETHGYKKYSFCRTDGVFGYVIFCEKCEKSGYRFRRTSERDIYFGYTMCNRS